ncbi:MAG: hypothetical protein WEF86_13675 [Gemmatimonadota bacterium]
MLSGFASLLAIVVAQGSAQSPLELEQVRAWSLADDFLPSAFSYSAQALLAIDGVKRQIVVVDPHAGMSTIHVAGTSRLLAASLTTDGGFQLVDSLGYATADARGVVVRRVPFEPLNARIVAAENIGDAWYYVRQGVDVRVICDATRSPSVSAPLHLYGGAVTGHSGQTMLVLSAAPPFAFYILDSQCEAVRIAGDIPLPPTRVNPLGFRTAWRVVSVVPMGDTYVVSLADLRSDARLLAVMSTSGHLLRTKEFAHAFSIVGAVADDLMAIRMLDRRQIIQYRAIQDPDELPPVQGRQR